MSQGYDDDQTIDDDNPGKDHVVQLPVTSSVSSFFLSSIVLFLPHHFLYFKKITFEDLESCSLLKHFLFSSLSIIVLRKICRQNFILSFVINCRNHPLFNYLKGITTIRLEVLFLCSLQTFNIYFNTSTRVVDAQT